MRLSIQPRQDKAPGRTALVAAVNVAAVFALLSLVFLAVGANPLQALGMLVTTGFSGGYSFSEVLVKTAPLICTGLAVAVALQMKLWNIGADGQLYMGALGTIWAARAFAGLPAALMIPLTLLAAMVFGAFWSGIAGFLKMTLNVNEILTTLMLNYVATSLVAFLVYGPWKDPAAMSFPRTAYIDDAARLPQFFGTRVHAGLLVAIALAVVMWFVIKKTSWGFEIQTTGESRGAASYAGIKIARNTLVVFLICGALAGVAGMGEISGLYHRLQQSNLAAGYGNYGIIVAWLAGAHPLAVVLVAFLFGVVLVGADALQVSMGISTDMVQIILGLIMCGILCARFFSSHTIRVSFKRKEGAADA